MTAWVCVADQLPAPGVEVLAYWEQPAIHGGNYMRVVYRHGSNSHGVGSTYWVDGRSTYEAPTHWQPLPPPPEAT